MRSLQPIVAAMVFLPVSDFVVAWAVVGWTIVGIALVGCLAVKFGRPGAKAKLGV